MAETEDVDLEEMPLAAVLAQQEAMRVHAAGDAAYNTLRRDLQRPPSDPIAERGVLAAFFADPVGAVRAVQAVGLEPEHFFVEAHETIAGALYRLHEDGEAINVSTVSIELARRDQLDRVGGTVALQGLDGMVRNAAATESYARVVIENSARRRALDVARNIASAAIQRQTPAQIVRYVEAQLVTIHVPSRSAFRAKLDKARRALEDVGVSKRRWDEPAGKSAADLVAAPRTPVPWLVQGLLREQGVHVSGAPPKTGKTWEELEIAISVATGTKAFGEFQVRAQGRVLLFLLEDDERDIQVRLRALVTGRRMEPAEALKGIDYEARGTINLLDLDDCAGIVASVWHHEERTQEKMQLVGIDPLRDANTGKENDNDDARVIMHNVRAMRRVARTGVLMQHHMAKPGEQRGKVEDIFDTFRGASAIRGAWDGGIAKRVKTKTPTSITSVISVETKGSAAAGTFGLNLDITDDNDGHAMSAGWAFYRDPSELDPPPKGGKATTQAERKDGAKAATLSWLAKAYAQDIAGNRAPRTWTAPFIAEQLGRKDRTATWRHLKELCSESLVIDVAGRFRALGPSSEEDSED